MMTRRSLFRFLAALSFCNTQSVPTVVTKDFAREMLDAFVPVRVPWWTE